jgi:5-methylcytosine-specific restriction endonuclease McrA
MQAEAYVDARKRCCRCKLTLPTTEFHRATKRPDGLQTICKACTREHNRARKQANPDWWKPYHAQYVLTDEQRAANIKRARQWLRDNPERARENARRWNAKNPTKVREIVRKRTATRRAREAGAFVEHVDGAVLWERDGGVCGICSTVISDSFETARFQVDHIVPLARGGEHSYANTQVAHPECNRRKWAYLPEELAA